MKPIMPENTLDSIEAYMIGVTNMVKESVGEIGIRLKASDKYGPTGEIPKASNIIGVVYENQELISDLIEGDSIYFMTER